MVRLLIVFAIMLYGIYHALRDRFAALLLYFWFALFRPQEFVWIDITSLRLSLILGLLLVVPCLLSGRWPDLSHPLSKGAALTVMFALVAQMGAVNPALGWEWTDYLFRLVLVCLLATRLITTTRELVLVVTVIACSFGFHTAKAGLASLLGSGVRFEDGLGGAFSTNNGYGLGAAMITFLLVAAAQNSTHRWLRRGLFTAAPLSAFTVVSTFSRGAFLALIAGGLVLGLLHRRRAQLLAGLVLVGLLGYAFVPIPAGYIERLSTIQPAAESTDESIQSRPHFWEVALAMAADRPLGVGLRNFGDAYDSYDFSGGRYGRGRDVHSSYFQMIAELGFGGGLVFIWLLVYTCVVLFRIRSRATSLQLKPDDRQLFLTVANGVLASVVSFIVGGAFGSYALNDLTWYSFAVTAALDRMSAAALKEANEEANSHRTKRPTRSSTDTR